MALDNGDGFITCTCGARHWGRYGAAGLLLNDPARGVLLQYRASWTHHGSTWALPGGAVSGDETPVAGALREAQEEAAVPPSAVRPISAFTVDHGTWRYTTVLACSREHVEEKLTSPESAELRWVAPEDVAELPLHPDFAAAWPGLSAQLGRQLVLVVDAANVVGSRPDGWWRDRAGAAARLRDRLAVLAHSGATTGDLDVPELPGWSWWPSVALVVEGQARETAPATDVEVVAAVRDGDSEMVRIVAETLAARPSDQVVVATADRALQAQVQDLGARVLGPSALLRLLDRLAVS